MLYGRTRTLSCRRPCCETMSHALRVLGFRVYAAREIGVPTMCEGLSLLLCLSSHEQFLGVSLRNHVCSLSCFWVPMLLRVCSVMVIADLLGLYFGMGGGFGLYIGDVCMCI